MADAAAQGFLFPMTQLAGELDQRAATVRRARAMLEDVVHQAHGYWTHRRHAQARATPIKSTKVGRNDPCPCGSGQKYKKCCALKAS